MIHARQRLTKNRKQEITDLKSKFDLYVKRCHGRQQKFYILARETPGLHHDVVLLKICILNQVPKIRKSEYETAASEIKDVLRGGGVKIIRDLHFGLFITMRYIAD